jgi:hypothetical protein
MDGTFWNIFIFLASTVGYFIFLKPKLSTDILENDADYVAYISSTHAMLSLYFIGTILLQYFINSAVIINKCGGSSASNMGVAAMLTFVPWFLIFGMVIVVLIIFPGFKSAFSDVIGYFWVAKNANSLLSDLLLDTDVGAKLNNENLSPQEKQRLENTASVIIKIAGNLSTLINQIVPENFQDYWKMLTPLMKDEYKNNMNSADLLSKKQKLLEIVVTRDDVGEAFWYIYTALLLISIVQFNIVSQGCSKDINIMRANLDDYLSEQNATDKKNKATSVTYVNTVGGTLGNNNS